MTDLMTAPPAPSAAPDTRPVVGDREGKSMLLREALARSRQREAEEAARRYRLVRSVRAANRGLRPRQSLLAVLFRRTARTRAAAARRAAFTRVAS